MSQLDLFHAPEAGRVRRTDPRSSLQAARVTKSEEQRRAILRELRGCLTGLTCDDLQERTGIIRSTVAARMPQLKEAGLAYAFGYRANPNGVEVMVWFAKAAPREVDVEVTGERL